MLKVFIPLINKPTCVSRISAASINHILTSTINEHEIKSGVRKTDISGHFPIFT